MNPAPEKLSDREKRPLKRRKQPGWTVPIFTYRTFSGEETPRKEVHWVKPKVVVEIGFTEWTRPQVASVSDKTRTRDGFCKNRSGERKGKSTDLFLDKVRQKLRRM